MTTKEQLELLKWQNDCLYRALTALLEVNYPYREARARAILTEFYELGPKVEDPQA